MPELIDAAVSLMRQHYLELVTANALGTVPVLVLSFVFASRMGTFTPGTVPALPTGFFVYVTAMFFGALVLGGMANAATVVIVSDNYLGHEVAIASAIARALSRLGAVVGAGLLQGILIGLGFLLIVPGFFCIAWFFAAVNVVMVEGKGPSEALGRSRALAKGSVGRILGTLLVCGIIIAIVQGVIKAAIGLLIVSAHPTDAINALIGNVINMFLFPFFTVMTTLLYYDLRIRKEGFDLDLMAKELTAAVPPPAPA